MSEFVSKSRFAMWRAVVAMIHADEIVKPHEINYILEQTRNLPLSDVQRDILKDDILTPRNIEALFADIISPHDKEDFFHLARAISWSDGDFDERESEAIAHIGRLREKLGYKDAGMESFKDRVSRGDTDESGHNVIDIIRGLLHRRSGKS